MLCNVVLIEEISKFYSRCKARRVCKFKLICGRVIMYQMIVMHSIGIVIDPSRRRLLLNSCSTLSLPFRYFSIGGGAFEDA